MISNIFILNTPYNHVQANMLVMEQVVLINLVAFVVKKENRVLAVNWPINALV
jgi:hypothetical protein